MVKKNSKSVGIDMRHWILVAVVVAFAATNALWYEAAIQQEEINEAQTQDLIKLQDQINKLK